MFPEREQEVLGINRAFTLELLAMTLNPKWLFVKPHMMSYSMMRH